MQNFQGIIFILFRIYREIFKSALAYLKRKKMSFIKKNFIGKEKYGTVTTVKLVPKIEEA